MAGSINQVIILGNVGQDPKISEMNNGQKVATFSVATSERWKDKATGQEKENTEWNRIVVFNPSLIEKVEKYLQKGSRVYLEGTLRTRKWTAKNGTDMFTTEIILNGYRAKLLVLANGKETERPPIPDNPPDSPYTSAEEVFEKAAGFMNDEDILY